MTRLGDDRVASMQQAVRLGDATAQGRLRLDAVARYLQDVATEDTAEVHLPSGRGWVLRRMTCDISRLPAIYEQLEVTTRCTGVGGRWAERTTTLEGIDGLNANRTAIQRGVLVTARAVWVYVSLETGAPQSLTPEFFAAYGDAIRAHKVSARLVLPRPPVGACRRSWPLRSTDIDVFGHVNNAIYWGPVEDLLAGQYRDRLPIRVEIEFGSGVDPGDVCELVTTTARDAIGVWFMVGPEVRAAIRVELAPTVG